MEGLKILRHLRSTLVQDLSCRSMPRSPSPSDSDSDEDTYCNGCQSFRRGRHSCTPPPSSPKTESSYEHTPKNFDETNNNNINDFKTSLEDCGISKSEFLAGFQLQRSPESYISNAEFNQNLEEEEEQDAFVHEYRKMKLKGIFPCRLCRASFPNLRALKGHNRVHMAYGILQCNLCPYVDSDKNGLIRHMRCHNGDRPYECSLCNFAFTTKANCERHLRNRHSATKTDLRGCIIHHEESEKRDATTMTNLQLSNEMDAPLDLSTKKSPESLRSSPVPSPSPMMSNPPTPVMPAAQYPFLDVRMVVKNGLLVPKQKQRRYRTERPFGCEHCTARFTLRSNMERHVKQQHPEFYSARKRRPRDLGTVRKEDIGQEDKAGVTLVLASRTSHNETPLIQKRTREEDLRDLATVSRLLDNATGTFRQYFGDRTEVSDEEGLVASGSDNSSDDKSEPETQKKKSAYSLAPNRVSCPYCFRKFPWSSSLRRHILTHTGQKPFKCAHCPLLFTTKSNCDRHLLRKHGAGDRAAKRAKLSLVQPETVAEGSEMPFKCHLCEGSFSEREEALKHLQVKHRSEYENLLSKGALESSAEDEEDENRHRADYANRKVVCALCLRRFWSAEDLRRHMRTHTGERPFACSVCQRRFTLKHSMLRHRKKHHLGGEEAHEPVESDLIGNLLGIKDKNLVDAMIEKGPTDAAKILGIQKSQ